MDLPITPFGLGISMTLVESPQWCYVLAGFTLWLPECNCRGRPDSSEEKPSFCIRQHTSNGLKSFDFRIRILGLAGDSARKA